MSLCGYLIRRCKCTAKVLCQQTADLWILFAYISKLVPTEFRLTIECRQKLTIWLELISIKMDDALDLAKQFGPHNFGCYSNHYRIRSWNVGGRSSPRFREGESCVGRTPACHSQFSLFLFPRKKKKILNTFPIINYREPRAISFR